MIIKNIAPYPKEVKALKISLLPGQESDISQFSPKERQDCFELQEAFRKGEFICIGVGQHDRESPSVEARAQRAFSQGTHGRQPLAAYKTSGPPGPLKREFDDLSEPRPVSREVPVEQALRYHRDKRGVKCIDKMSGIIERDARGITSIRSVEPIPTLPKATKPPVEEPPVPLPTISRERARELIMSSRCVGICSNGRQCKRRPVTGYEYCVLHMPKELQEEYKRQKQQAFLKE